jgi:hypothetical protein
MNNDNKLKLTLVIAIVILLTALVNKWEVIFKPENKESQNHKEQQSQPNIDIKNEIKIENNNNLINKETNQKAPTTTDKSEILPRTEPSPSSNPERSEQTKPQPVESKDEPLKANPKEISRFGKIFQKDNLVVELKGCSQSDSYITCEFKIMSKERDVLFGMFNGSTTLGPPTRIIDEEGNEYLAQDMTLANSTNASGNRGTEKTLIAGFSINGSITFSDVNRDVKLLAKLELSSWCDSPWQGNYHFKIPFKVIEVD